MDQPPGVDAQAILDVEAERHDCKHVYRQLAEADPRLPVVGAHKGHQELRHAVIDVLIAQQHERMHGRKAQAQQGREAM